MPIISSGETRNLRGKLLQGTLVVVLSLGAVTMIYPFLLMLSGSTRSVYQYGDPTPALPFSLEAKPTEAASAGAGH
jgi:hypothetical protein